MRMAFMLWEYMNGVMLVFVWGGSVGGFQNPAAPFYPILPQPIPPLHITL